ncbi:hypothetical protein Tco_0157792 [Tanacetum coccineum]
MLSYPVVPLSCTVEIRVTQLLRDDWVRLLSVLSIRRHSVVMISILVTPRVSASAGYDRLVSEPLVIEKTEGDRIVDRLSDARNRAGPAELGDSCGGKEASCGTEGDRIVDRLSDARNRAGPAE